MNKVFEEQIKIFKLMSNDAKKMIEELKAIYNKHNIQHTVLLISLSRAIKYFDAYIILVENGFVEPASDLIRSMYHTLLWMRWSLISKENAEIYFNIGKQDLKRMLNKVISMGIISIKGASNEEETLKILKAKTDKIVKPDIKKQVDETGYSDLHNLVYTMLAGISHGSINLLDKDKTYSYEPNGKYLEMFFEVANNVFRDCKIVAEQFTKEGTIRPVPDVLELTGIKKRK